MGICMTVGGKQTIHKYNFATFCHNKRVNNSPVAMVVQIAFLAERLGAERAEHLQSQVLGSIVAVKIPPRANSLMNFFLKSSLFSRLLD